MKEIILYLFVAMLSVSCTDNISRKESKYMPYDSGDVLVFENPKNTLLDTIFISKIDRYVSDGPKIYFNESIKAYDKKGDYIIHLSAGYLKYPDSYLKIRGLSGRHCIKDLNKKTEISLSTRTMSFDDVILIEKESGGNSEIIKIYWSKSKGIVQFEKDNHTIWQLISLSSYK
ncbi:hypothetical protein [Marinifilum fragile]|uniref:hypothetical protein n=1 Tax=Marinifilum fragile TaxID=570161 RepID=UPI002AA5F24E|nr:hypothetical protein [Marinifilum fragile]